MTDPALAEELGNDPALIDAAERTQTALSVTVDPETQARHLEQIRQSLAASDTRMTYWADRHVAAERRIEDLERAQGIAEDRIVDLEDKVEALVKAIRELRFQAVTWNEAIVPKPPADACYEDARRALKVVGATEIIMDFGWDDDLDEGGWEEVCTELFRRYGHLRHTDGTPFWTKPPTVSEKTKALIAEALKLR